MSKRECYSYALQYFALCLLAGKLSVCIYTIFLNRLASVRFIRYSNACELYYNNSAAAQ